jgi:hypothetical protein
MIKCGICGLECKQYKSLGNHIKRKHNMNTEEYYNIYLNNDMNKMYCSVCGIKVSFYGLKNGYPDKCMSCDRKDKTKYEKMKQTLINRYGVENISQINNVKQKKEETYINKYSVKNISQLEEIKEKKKKSKNINFSNEEIIEKMKQTCLKKYGCEYTFQSEEVKNKIKKTNLEKYGCENPQQNKEIKEKTLNIFFETFYKKILDGDRIGNCIPLFTLDEYNGVELKYKFKCTKCDKIFLDNINDGRIPKCPVCYPKYRSKLEMKIYEYIKSIHNELIIIQNDRSLIYPLELDILIPDLKIAIEVNGTFWHTEEKGKGEEYHKNKSYLCENLGYKLIHIWEHEWEENQEKVKNMLKEMIT